jgi:uncharacterized glyoxalase superfamily protein PhnB
MKSTPPGWPRISSSVFYEDPRKAIDWLCQAFGFEVRIKVEGKDGEIEHSELVYGDGLIMVGGVKGTMAYRRSPKAVGGANTQSLFAYVDDIEAHLKRATAAGAKIDRPLETNDYGPAYWTDRTYGCEDLEGHHWYFSQRMRTGSAG